MNIFIALLVASIVAYCVVKRYKAQTILIVGGLAMMMIAYGLGYKTTPFVTKNATGLALFDMFEYINQLLIKDVAGLGLVIMIATGFAKYMDYIGASSRMVELAMKPLSMLNAPYLVLAASFLLCNSMALVIPSVSALAILMMVTIYPVLTRLGVSKVGAASVVGTGHILDIGPASPTTLFVAKTGNIAINKFFIEYQVPVYVVVCLVGSLTHYMWQKYRDKKEVLNHQGEAELDLSKATGEDLNPPGPTIYALLPIVPLVMLLGFSEYAYKGIKMNVNLAMMFSFSIAMLFELIRYRDVKKVAASIQVFLRGMGDQFVNTVSLITAGQTFAYGLTCIGFVGGIIAVIKGAKVGMSVITLVLCIFLFFISMLMGSGVAATFAFAPLVPDFAQALNGNPVVILQAMQNSASLGRLISPITAALIATAGIAGISVVDLVKRNIVPVVVCAIVNVIAIIMIFH